MTTCANEVHPSHGLKSLNTIKQGIPDDFCVQTPTRPTASLIHDSEMPRNSLTVGAFRSISAAGMFTGLWSNCPAWTFFHPI